MIIAQSQPVGRLVVALALAQTQTTTYCPPPANDANQPPRKVLSPANIGQRQYYLDFKILVRFCSLHLAPLIYS